MITVFYYPMLINEQFIEQIMVNDDFNGALELPIETFAGKYIPIQTDDQNNSVIKYTVVFDTFNECAIYCNNINKHNHE